MSKVNDSRALLTVPGFGWDTLDARNQSCALSVSLHQHRDLKESLAAYDHDMWRSWLLSRGEKKNPDRPTLSEETRSWLYDSFPAFYEALSLQKEVVESAVGRFEEYSDDTQLFTWLVPKPEKKMITRFLVSGDVQSDTWFIMYESIPRFESATADQKLIDDQEQTRFTHELNAAFETEPLEDGMHHMAEEIIRQALQSREGERILEWLKDFSLDIEQPVFAASVLRCLGRQVHPGTESWRTDLVNSALDLDNVEIRDAAVQAVELWGDPEILPVLESHNEPEQWLQDYICDVIDDLGE